MAIKPNSLKSFFNWIRKSPIDDVAIKAAKSNVDDLALGALDTVDDIPKTVSLNDILDAQQNSIPLDKAPITPSEFKQNFLNKWNSNAENRALNNLYPERVQEAPTLEELTALRDNAPSFGLSEPFKLDGTPDFDALNIDPKKFGQSYDPVDFILYPDGFDNPDDFAHYHTALEQGYLTTDLGPYLHPVQDVRYRSPYRTKRAHEIIQQVLAPYTVSGDTSANSPELAKLYKKITGTY